MRSIAVKLTLAFLLVGITGAVLVAVILQVRTRSEFDQFILNQEQQLLVDSLLQHYRNQGSWEGVGNQGWLTDENEKTERPFPANRNIRRELAHFTLVGADGRIVYSTQSDLVGQMRTPAELEDAIPLVIDDQTVGWLLLKPITPEWLVSSPEAIFLASINRASLASGLAAAGLALVVGSVLAWTMTRSLRELTDATEDIARGNLGRQVQVRSKDEIGELAASFNQMSADLSRATRSRRQMTADIAHDLRSPLSVISGYAEALADGKLPGDADIYAILHQETQHLSHLIDDLRTLSLADAGELALTRLPTAPLALLERVAARHALAAQQRGLALRVEADSALPAVFVDPERLVQVFDNLIQNAFRFTPSGGSIALSAHSAAAGVEFAVNDTGSGILAEDLPYIFDRSYRGDKARQQNGESGLGLAIAKSIIEAHGGSIGVESVPGRGASFRFHLPLAAQGL